MEEEHAISLLECFKQFHIIKIRFEALDNMLADISPHLHVRYVQEYNTMLDASEELKILNEKIKALEEQRDRG